jgi:hypothetical protein
MMNLLGFLIPCIIAKESEPLLGAQLCTVQPCLYRVQRRSHRVQRSSVGSALGCCKIGPEFESRLTALRKYKRIIMYGNRLPLEVTVSEFMKFGTPIGVSKKMKNIRSL